MASDLDRVTEYRRFPNELARNDSHEAIDVPLMAWVLEIPSGKDVLEIGCGVGASLGPLARLCRPRRLVGVDIDSTLLGAAALRCGGVPKELLRADARCLPFPDACFDVVVDFGTCYHVARPGAALSEIARVLRPGGRFVTETRLNQLTSHPVRAWGRRLPLGDVAGLVPVRRTLMWQAWQRR